MPTLGALPFRTRPLCGRREPTDDASLLARKSVMMAPRPGSDCPRVPPDRRTTPPISARRVLVQGKAVGVGKKSWVSVMPPGAARPMVGVVGRGEEVAAWGTGARTAVGPRARDQICMGPPNARVAGR
jgi:hypothetical protein